MNPVASVAPADEPTIPPRLHRPLAAVWISLGLHAAIIALIQVAPPASVGEGAMIEARLVPSHQAQPAVPAPPAEEKPAPDAPAPVRLAPADEAEAQPLADPAETAAAPAPQPAAAQPPAETAEPAAPSPTRAGMGVPVDLVYYSARELDVQPRARSRIVPDYPDDADRERVSGRVRLQVKLEADGRVSAVEVVEADPPGVFDASAVRAFRAARFSPAQRGGRPVRALLLIEVEYDWEGRR